jgi:hypothetical protein
MAGFSAQGGELIITVFSNDGNAGNYTVIPTSVSITSPTPEVTDATGVGHLAGAKVMVPTGACASAGTMAVDFIATGGFTNPQAIVGKRCRLSFQSPNYTIVRNTILTGADVNASQGDIVRGNLNFQLTDYYGI